MNNVKPLISPGSHFTDVSKRKKEGNKNEKGNERKERKENGKGKRERETLNSILTTDKISNI